MKYLLNMNEEFLKIRRCVHIQVYPNMRLGIGIDLLMLPKLTCPLKLAAFPMWISCRNAGLYKGIVPSIIKAVPTGAVTFVAYEFASDWLESVWT
ncbi:hypothetical protein BUALT_Bualt14G0070800 [Buddleja alternifolia]|uniref:Uncharacterized protein n=1 Tax=Buddleja alternifolia TaxID=168488 RepID=A0AAV6WNG9_9LAMI|nr:hypothetical protein BUALT_Bualt14G0070800 [Buddleja alternifolia]